MDHPGFLLWTYDLAFGKSLKMNEMPTKQRSSLDKASFDSVLLPLG
jgi:hypothetical protein